MDLEEYIESLSNLIEEREYYQQVLAKTALEVMNKHGIHALEVLSEEIKERHGKIISTSTLRNYAWIEKRTHHLSLPADITYNVRYKISKTDNPEKWAKKIINEGLDSKMVSRLLREETKSKHVCKTCGRIYYTNKD